MAVQPPALDVPSPSNSTAAKLPSSSHRLPTVSASEALLNLSDHEHGPSNVLTGVPDVDEVLGDGFELGKVAELWGPVGAGKTAIALAAARNVLNSGRDVVWIDTTTPLAPKRLQSATSSSSPLSHFHRTQTPTLTHLLALLLHPHPNFPPPNTTLLVLTALHSALETTHPRHATFPAGTKPDVQKWAASRRYAILGSIASALNKLAAVHNITVLVTTGCATRSRGEFGASGGLGLVPGVGGSEWDAGIWTRAAIFQDFAGRFVGAQKVRGAAVPSPVVPMARLGAFTVSGSGAAIALPRDENRENGRVEVVVSPVRSRKRAFEEVADSDGEEGDEYGDWAELEADSLIGVEQALEDEVVEIKAPEVNAAENEAQHKVREGDSAGK